MSRDRPAMMCNSDHVDEAHDRDGAKAERQSLNTPVPLWYVGGWVGSCQAASIRRGSTTPLLAPHEDGGESMRRRY